MPSPSLPSPPSLPFFGNLFELDGDALIQSLTRFAGEYGPIYRLEVLGFSTTVISGQKYVNEACDETRFGKLVHSALVNLRPATGDGLFTAFATEPNWARAHNILMPAFGPMGIRGMFGKMTDIARQMFDRWERFGPESPIDVADAMTRLTLDTLALCAFDLRFNSFYQDDMHPFVDAMVGALLEASARDRRPPFMTAAMIGKRRRFSRNVEAMHELADRLVAQRRREGDVGSRGDLLDRMLTGVDPQTGQSLDDENIRYQLVTFLIAGHETTSGLLSFTVHLLLDNPDVLARATALIDAQLGDRDPTLEDLGALRFIEQILMESLRLWPTAPAFAVTPHTPTMLAGEYPFAPGDELLILLPALHRDPAVWGANAGEFRPERFDRAVAEKLPPNAWKPFGNGQRACIGRGFAMQEAQLVLTMLLQRFTIAHADQGYDLKIAETLTIKPDGLRIHARRRSPRPADRPASTAGPLSVSSPPFPAVIPTTGAEALVILHGGNSGSCTTFARQLAAEGKARGRTVRVATMDEAAGALPEAGDVIVIAASYEGLPADNARRFMDWIDRELKPGQLAGRRFAVLGCGNRQWARTYQAVPKKVDAALAAAGATRIITRGEADAAGDFVDAAERWMDELWDTLDGRERSAPAARRHPEARLLPSADSAMARRFAFGHCVDRHWLTSRDLPAANAKCHVEIALPAGVTYRPGDYLAVLPANPPHTVARALKRFGLAMDTRIAFEPGDAALLPFACAEPLWAETVFGHLVEWEQPLTREQLHLFAGHARCPPDQTRIAELIRETAPGVGTLSLLEQLPSCDVPLGALLSVLPPMRERRYSIASSPGIMPDRCALTVSVVDQPSAHGLGRHLGVASNHLARLVPDMPVRVEVRPGAPGFHPPATASTPVVMIAAGSGIAPFRAFLQERAQQRARGEPVGLALLYFGCRDPEADWLYREELLGWVQDGLVDLRMAFSRTASNGTRYVQDQIGRDGEELSALAAAGAHFYVCGDAARMVPAVERALLEIVGQRLGVEHAAASRWARRFLAGRGRYAVDAFA